MERRWYGPMAMVCGLLAACGTPPVPMVAGADPMRGAAAITRYGCGTCHVIPGREEARGQVGPPLTAFARRVFVAGRLPNVPDSLAQWIIRPQFYAPGSAMPNMGIDTATARDMAAYLLSLR